MQRDVFECGRRKSFLTHSLPATSRLLRHNATQRNTGDPTGGLRRALASFPDQDMVQRIMDKYFIEGGKDENKSFKSLQMWSLSPSQQLLEVAVVANFCEVWLAKHNDDNTPTEGMVGINRLTKVQLPTIASLYGAMLADVDYVIMGAGIPLKVPGVLDNLSQGKEATFPVDVAGADEEMYIKFSPQAFWTAAGKPELAKQLAQLKRPNFLPIVSSVVLAQSMLKRADGQGPTKGIQGFVVELPTAGGHNGKFEQGVAFVFRSIFLTQTELTLGSENQPRPVVFVTILSPSHMLSI